MTTMRDHLLTHAKAKYFVLIETFEEKANELDVATSQLKYLSTPENFSDWGDVYRLAEAVDKLVELVPYFNALRKEVNRATLSVLPTGFSLPEALAEEGSFRIVEEYFPSFYEKRFPSDEEIVVNPTESTGIDLTLA